MCLLGIAPILHAVDRDIDAWFSVRPMPAHLDGDFAYASERPEVKTDADNIAAQIMVSVRVGAPDDVAQRAVQLFGSARAKTEYETVLFG